MIVFVADAFIEHYTGGAELTTESIIEAGLLPHTKSVSQRISVSAMKKFKHAFWIFGNFSNLTDECLIYAAKNLNYSVLEYDYKYCIYRSPEKHILSEGSCNCANERRGKVVSIFLNGAKATWWMSDNQLKHYQSKFEFLKNDKHRVLSSVFSRGTLDYIRSFEFNKKNNKWIILNSPSWIKGADDGIEYAKENNLDYELVWGLKYEELLEKLANSKGLIFLPKAGDTCPRMVIEAKLLGCELVLNDNVQHKDEPWFATKETAFEYLEKRTSIFWSRIEDVAGSLGISQDNDESDIRYNIVVPFYNAARWLPKCINSIKRQRHDNFICTLIDDVSDDNSYMIARMMTDGDDRFHIIKNEEKNYALKNIFNALAAPTAKEEDVVVLLDGDDWFASSKSLNALNKAYKDGEHWMTYGSYILHPYGIKGPEPSQYPDEIIEKNLYRKDHWRASHLRTFKCHLWNRIDDADLKDEEGNFYDVSYDQAIMLPLLEMAGSRAKYIDSILHVYNKENPLNVDKIKTQKQSETAKEIRSKRRYERIE